MTRHPSTVTHTATHRAGGRHGLRAGAIRRVENASQFSTLRSSLCREDPPHSVSGPSDGLTRSRTVDGASPIHRNAATQASRKQAGP